MRISLQSETYGEALTWQWHNDTRIVEGAWTIRMKDF